MSTVSLIFYRRPPAADTGNMARTLGRKKSTKKRGAKRFPRKQADVAPASLAPAAETMPSAAIDPASYKPVAGDPTRRSGFERLRMAIEQFGALAVAGLEPAHRPPSRLASDAEREAGDRPSWTRAARREEQPAAAALQELRSTG